MYDKEINGFGVQLKPLEQEQIERVRLWRNNPEISQFMFEQGEISQEQQQAWFDSLKKKDNVGFWLAHYKNEVIGVINVTSVNGSSVEKASTLEPGLYMVPESRYKNSILAFCPSLALIDYFFKIGTQVMEAKVKSTNSAALRYNEMLGYKVIAEKSTSTANASEIGADIITMRLERQSFAKAKDRLTKIIRF